MYNPIAARDDFGNAAKIITNAVNAKLRTQGKPDLTIGQVIDQYQLTQSTLRLEQPLVTTNPIYTFPISTTSQGTAAPFLTEIRLQQTDTFVPTQIAVGFGNATTAGGGGDARNDIRFKFIPYPSPFLFPLGFDAMQTMYNGQLKFAINNYQYLYGWDLLRHYFAPQTQATAAPGANSPIDQFDLSSDSFYPMQPFILFNGLQNLTMQVVLPGSITAIDTTTRMIILIRGVTAQNSTVAV